MSAHRPIAHRAFTVLLTFLLVSSMFAPITAAEPAAAQTDSTALNSGCSVTVFLSFEGGISSCPSSFLNQELNELQDANDIYNYGLNGKAGTESAFTFFDNYLKDTRGPARMRMQLAVSEAFQNDTSEAQATSDARAAVTEYYTTKEENLLRTYNTSAHLADGMVQRTETAGFDPRNTTRLVGASSEYDYTFTGSFKIVGYETVELADNSTTVEMPVMETTLDSQGTHSAWGEVNITSTTQFTLSNASDGHTLQYEQVDGSETGSFDISFSQVNLRHATDQATYPTEEYLSITKFDNRRSTVVDQRDEMLNYSESFVSNTWAAYQDGRIDADDVVSRLTQLEGFTQDAVGENATMDDIVVALSSMGLATPDLNSTGYMSVSFTPESGSSEISEKGMLLSSSSPDSGSWVANTTYSPSEIENSTPLMMAGESGEQWTINASHSVTLNEIVDTDGNNVNETETDDLPDDYETVETAELISQLNESLQRIEELEQQKEDSDDSNEDDGTIGLPGIPGLPEGGGVFVGLAIIGLAVLVVVGFVTDSIPGLGNN